MSLSSYYPAIKDVHVTAVVCSGSLFTARGFSSVLGWRHAMHPALRYLSYAIDVVLLTAAVCLAFILRQAPLFSGWLTVKVLLLLVYFALGSIALKRGRTRGAKMAALISAVVVYLFIASVALSHDPRGALAILWR